MTMTSAYPITYEEACKLLGLSSRKKHSAEEIKQAYLLALNQWSTKLSVACGDNTVVRIRKTIALLQEAQSLLLEKIAGRSGTSGAHVQPGTSPRPARTRQRASAAYAVPRSSFFGATHQRFSTCCSGIKTFFAVCRAIPEALLSISRSFRTSIHNIENHGVPRIAVILGLLFGLLLIVHGCELVKTPH